MRLPLILLSVSALSLSACSYNSDPMGKPLPDLTYSHLTPISINGGHFDVTRTYLTSKDWRAPNASERQSKTKITNFVMPLDSAVERYVASRFQREGGQPTVALNIEKVDINYMPSVRAEDVYQAFVILTFAKLDLSGASRGSNNLTIKKTLKIPPHYSLAEREFAQFEFVEAVIHEIDNGVSIIVRDKLQ